MKLLLATLLIPLLPLHGAGIILEDFTPPSEAFLASLFPPDSTITTALWSRPNPNGNRHLIGWRDIDPAGEDWWSRLSASGFYYHSSLKEGGVLLSYNFLPESRLNILGHEAFILEGDFGYGWELSISVDGSIGDFLELPDFVAQVVYPFSDNWDLAEVSQIEIQLRAISLQPVGTPPVREVYLTGISVGVPEPRIVVLALVGCLGTLGRRSRA